MKSTKTLWITTIILLFLNVVLYTTKWGGETVLLYVSDMLPIICSLIAVVCLLKAYRSFSEFDFVKVAWLMILVGITFDFFAESTYAILEIGLNVDMNETFPTVADIFWCIGYIPVLIGLSMMLIGYGKSHIAKAC